MHARPLAVAAFAAVLVLTGCSAADSTEPLGRATSSQSAAYNQADETFAMEMIAHHQAAVDMAEVVLGKTGVDAVVVDLASKIKAAQSPEIEVMRAWLDDWGVPQHSGAMHHGGQGDAAALKTANGKQASVLFLEQMITHHSDAIDMSRVELGNGKNLVALKLAQRIIDDQTAEIGRMQSLLERDVAATAP